jgi:hypothetical protein
MIQDDGLRELDTPLMPTTVLSKRVLSGLIDWLHQGFYVYSDKAVSGQIELHLPRMQTAQHILHQYKPPPDYFTNASASRV